MSENTEILIDNYNNDTLPLESLSVLFLSSNKKNQVTDLTLKYYNLYPESYKNKCSICEENLIKIQKGRIHCKNCSYPEDIITNKKIIYKPMKYVNKAISQVLGYIDKSDEYYNILEQLKNINEISPKSIRKYLQTNKESKFYKHISAFYQDLTTKVTISDELYRTLITEFERVITIFTKIDVSKNTPNFNYIIYKLIELFGNDDDKLLLNCIYLQSINNIIKLDKTWKQICERANYKYISTKIYSL